MEDGRNAREAEHQRVYCADMAGWKSLIQHSLSTSWFYYFRMVLHLIVARVTGITLVLRSLSVLSESLRYNARETLYFGQGGLSDTLAIFLLFSCWLDCCYCCLHSYSQHPSTSNAVGIGRKDTPWQRNRPKQSKKVPPSPSPSTMSSKMQHYFERSIGASSPSCSSRIFSNSSTKSPSTYAPHILFSYPTANQSSTPM